MSLGARLARFAETASLGAMRVGGSFYDVERVHGECYEAGVPHRGRWPRLFGFGDVETLPGQTAIIADITAVSFVFDLEDGEPPRLNVVGALGDYHECPECPECPKGPAAPR